MKGFPEIPDGPLGYLYKRINEAVALAMDASDSDSVRQILGDPDDVEVVAESDRVSDDGALDSQYPEIYWLFRDPYRPQRSYRFGISGRTIVERSRIIRP